MNGEKRSLAQKIALCAIVGALVGVLGFPNSAYGYFSYEGPYVDVGAGSVSVTAGQSMSVMCSVSPLSEQQLPGCGMAQCPQACGGLVTPGGVLGGCLNDAGWCTCNGETYYTEYTSVTTSSSNPAVATATWANNVLSVQGHGAGTATITVSASLAKHVGSSSTVSVTVGAAPAPDPNPAPSPAPDPVPTPTPTPDPSKDKGGSSGGSGSSSGSVSVSPSGVPAAALSDDDKTAAQEKTVVEAADGTQSIIVAAQRGRDAGDQLKEIAGTSGTVTYWIGEELSSPDLSWTFSGEHLDPEGDLSMKEGALVSKRGTSSIAKLLEGADDSLVVEFEQEGDFPAQADVHVRTAGVYEDGVELNLFWFDSETGSFAEVGGGLKPSDSYASFVADKGSVWALSSVDLAALGSVGSVEVKGESAAKPAAAPTPGIYAESDDSLPVGAVVAIVCAAIVLIGGGAFFVYSRKKRTAAASQSGDDVRSDIESQGGAESAALDDAVDSPSSESEGNAVPVTPSDNADPVRDEATEADGSGRIP